MPPSDEPTSSRSRSPADELVVPPRSRAVPTLELGVFALVCWLGSMAAYAEEPIRPLPAGSYFRGDDTCPGCPLPRFAVIAGIVQSVDDARALVMGTSSSDLPLGYPWVTCTEEVGLVGVARGIVVVTGLFARRAEAIAWLRHHRGRWPATARVVPLMSLARYHASLPGLEPSAYLVEIERGRDVPAYPADPPPASDDPEGVPEPTVRRVHPERAPVCLVHPGDLFLMSADERFDIVTQQWVPVRCGARIGWVRVTDTRLDTTVRTDPSGSSLLRQVVSIECGASTIREWPYDARGRIGEGVVVYRDAGPCENPCTGGTRCVHSPE